MTKIGLLGKDDGCQAGIGHVDADLEENHAEADIDQSQNGQISPIRPIDMNMMLLHIADGQRHEQDAAYEKAEKGQLEWRKGRTGDLQ